MIISNLKRILSSDERGGTLIFVVISLVVLLGFTALVIDGGRLYAEKSNLQKAVDASVLSSAYHYDEDDDAVLSEFKRMLKENGVPEDGGELSFTSRTGEEGERIFESNVDGTDYVITLTLTEQHLLGEVTRNKDLTFAKVINFDEADVYASAMVEFAFITGSKQISPISIVDDDFEREEEYSLIISPGNESGNFGYIDVGVNPRYDAIIEGGEVSVGEDKEYTNTGLSWGPLRDAVQDLIEMDEGDDECNDYETAHYDCNRVIFVPIVETFEDANGKDLVTITGIAAFWLDRIEKDGNEKEVVGKFLDTLTVGESGTIITEDGTCYGDLETCAEDTGVRVVRLVDPDKK
ncbi:Tad domain-containing protein [Aquisalibacillus elongatus]|uniref:Putative Flp pilus-assembly TadE/G-like protein n=1 Tax=Aquisalibacillus elongatus TaxID=485577 RepID=A0A3N5BEH5_9BACI|nr:Tad domain-containing protein [Aquisalibacillus elongatus]RPF55847.1 putative Flp pilus-assembly TadE/G-like protein [Aquisalibacillus elongatus]